MPSYNRVVLMGNCTRDLELKYLDSGIAVADMGLAINEKYKDKSGEMQDKTVFVDVVIWGNQAETCSQYLSKGSLCLVEGGLQLDTWEDKDSGAKRSKLRVRAQRVQFLNAKGSGEKQEREPASKPEPSSEPEPDMSTPSDDENLPF